jgi:hypothetical protein
MIFSLKAVRNALSLRLSKEIRRGLPPAQRSPPFSTFNF